MTYRTSYVSPLGNLLLTAEEHFLTGLWFEGQKHFPPHFLLNAMHEHAALPVFRLAVRWLDEYFAGRPEGILPPLKPQGSPFRQKVWQRLLCIPKGKTAAYGELAGNMAACYGVPVSAQAVGGAVAHNPISIFIPCHRVMGKGGRLTGYAGGTDRKKALLELEGVDTSHFTHPVSLPLRHAAFASC